MLFYWIIFPEAKSMIFTLLGNGFQMTCLNKTHDHSPTYAKNAKQR